MTSYLRSWLGTGTSAAQPTPTPVSPPIEVSISEPTPDENNEGDGGSDTETEQDDDSIPAFPSLNSAQRISTPSSKPIPKILSADSSLGLMPPPPLPGSRLGAPRNAGTSSSSLAVPTTTTTKPLNQSKKREKVALAPGHSPLDWASLKSSGEDLRGVDALLRIPPSLLKQHRKKDDAWTAINGKVYNITPYLPFHPGGERELMRCAGRDGTQLFASTHAWVNADFMLDQCMVGFLVPEPSS